MPGGRPAPAILRGFHKGRNPSLIVPCSQCHTRFKVPDHKVSARGLKVRCSRCRHTFRVFPEAPLSAGDPFAAFGPEGTSEMETTPSRGRTVAELLAQMQPKAEAGDDFDGGHSGEGPLWPEPAWSFPPAPARADEGGAVAVQAEEGERAPVVVRPLPDPVPAQVAAPGTSLAELDVVPAPPPPGAPPPFGSGDLASLAGFTPAWGVSPPVRALGTDGTLSHHQS